MDSLYTRVYSFSGCSVHAAKALLEHLPMTLDMSDLNENEKYYYLPDNLLIHDMKRSDTILLNGVIVSPLVYFGGVC